MRDPSQAPPTFLGQSRANKRYDVIVTSFYDVVCFRSRLAFTMALGAELMRMGGAIGIPHSHFPLEQLKSTGLLGELSFEPLKALGLIVNQSILF